MIKKLSHFCTVIGCDRKYYAKGYCRMHHARFLYDEKHGIVPNLSANKLIKPRKDKKCTVENCSNLANTRGMCGKHYYRSRHGYDLNEDLKSGAKAGELNPNWRGGVSEYKNHGVLKKIRLKKLKSKNYQCEVCGAPADEVHHLDRTKSNHSLRNLLAICTSCHMKLFHRHKKSTSKYKRIYGMTLVEIAQKLNLSMGTINKRHSLGTLSIFFKNTS